MGWVVCHLPISQPEGLRWDAQSEQQQGRSGSKWGRGAVGGRGGGRERAREGGEAGRLGRVYSPRATALCVLWLVFASSVGGLWGRGGGVECACA